MRSAHVLAAASLVERPSLVSQLAAMPPAGVVLVSAPPGSGKTVLVRSWVSELDKSIKVAWITVDRLEQDEQHLLLSLRSALSPGRVDPLRASPLPSADFDPSATARLLLTELDELDVPTVLVIDDLQELRAPASLALLEKIIERLPDSLRIVLITRHDPHLRLHRLRLTGRLLEIRAGELRFGEREAAELLARARVRVSGAATRLLVERTEGWVAGLRLAAISLVGHPDPERFVAEFSGTERTVGDYLIAEVLDRQPPQVRHLLLCTAVLEQVSGPLADALVGGSGSEAVLHALAEANAFVIAVDGGRSWFRYHQLFVDLLRLELRRTASQLIPELHAKAARWLEEHGFVLAAIRHAQAAQDWDRSARLLADHAFALGLDGRSGATEQLLLAFPPHIRAANPELRVVEAMSHLVEGRLDDAGVALSIARRGLDGVPAPRRRRFEVALAISGLSLARQRGDFSSVSAELQALETLNDPHDPLQLDLDREVRAMALMTLGSVEVWLLRGDDANRHLEEGLSLARKIDRPYLEVGCLGHLAMIANLRSFALAQSRSQEALAVLDAHGWGDDPVAALPLAVSGGFLMWTGRFEGARTLLDRAAAVVRPEAEPATALLIHLSRGAVHAALGELVEAVREFDIADSMRQLLVLEHGLSAQLVGFRMQAQIGLGHTDEVRAALAQLPDERRGLGESIIAQAAVELADGDPSTALQRLDPVLRGSAPVLHRFSIISALLHAASAQVQLDNPREAEALVEQALALAEPDRIILPFAMTPTRAVLQLPHHRTSHGALLADILEVLAGGSAGQSAAAHPPVEALSDGELRVLGYLPSNLSAAEIGVELLISVHTVKTHMRHIYAKLGVHRRSEAVARARELRISAPAARTAR